MSNAISIGIVNTAMSTHFSISEWLTDGPQNGRMGGITWSSLSLDIFHAFSGSARQLQFLGHSFRRICAIPPKKRHSSQQTIPSVGPVCARNQQFIRPTADNRNDTANQLPAASGAVAQAMQSG